MDSRTKEALLASIEKWERNASGPFSEATIFSDDCALCRLFFSRFRKNDGESCFGCPVSAKTGQWHCSGTPYAAAENAYWSDDEAAFRAAAFDEVAFLKSLLPEANNGNRD